MDSKTQTALREELEAQGQTPIDDDIFSVLSVGEIDLSNREAVAQAAKTLTQEHPMLFKQRNWETLSDNDFRSQESELRTRLSKAPALRDNEFKNLNSAVLNPEQEGALRRHLSGRGSTYDRAILKHALAEQARLYGGDAA